MMKCKAIKDIDLTILGRTKSFKKDVIYPLNTFTKTYNEYFEIIEDINIKEIIIDCGSSVLGENDRDIDANKEFIIYK